MSTLLKIASLSSLALALSVGAASANQAPRAEHGGAPEQMANASGTGSEEVAADLSVQKRMAEENAQKKAKAAKKMKKEKGEHKADASKGKTAAAEDHETQPEQQ